MPRRKKECPNCHYEISSPLNFCPQCGESLEEQVSNDEEHQNEITKELTNNEEIKTEVKEIVSDVQDTKQEEVEPSVIEGKQELVVNSASIEKPRSFEKNKKYIYPVIAIVITFALCLAAFSCFYQYYLKNLVIETTKREVTVTDTGISEAVEKVYDSVVVVESYVKNRLYATGTGFVYKTDNNYGYIITNDHVIENADEVKVVFTNNKRETVEIVGQDSYSDIALLSVKKESVIKVAEIGSSENLKVGDTSFAVGAPLDSSTYAWTTTRGIISGKNRTVEVNTNNGSDAYVMQVLQTDAAINNGNSGGPLCNSNGEVIGVTNMKLASSTIEGMGFAIPIETATKYADKFIAGEKITHPFLGVTVYEATPTFQNPDASGVYIESVQDRSPASKGGLKKGDKIIKINEKETSSLSFFRYELYKYEVGEEITITVERDGRERNFKIVLGSSGALA